MKPRAFSTRISVPTPPRQTQRPGVPGFARQAVHTTHPDSIEAFAAQFMGPTTSKSEGYIYFVLLKLKGEPGYEGAWGYQIGSRGLGNAVIDFVVWDQTPELALRVWTSHFHTTVGTRIKQFDERSKRALERQGYKVIDLFEEHFINDPSGRAAFAVTRDALRGVQRPNPATTRTSHARPL